MSESVRVLLERLSGLWSQAQEIWLAGGWAMIGIAAIALVMFAVGTNTHLKLRRKGFASVSEATWRRWIDRPAERTGPIGRLLDQISDSGARSVEEVARVIDQLRASESRPFERDLRVMKVCVGAAPLVGLLGTVTGMLATFGALASGSGGEKTMALVASGISEALITTETGLVIALPGLFFQYQLARRHERYKAFLAHLESVCTQIVWRRLRRDERAAARRVALRGIARRICSTTRQRQERSPRAAAPRPPQGRGRLEVKHGTLS
jgi:biopolymer transport protein ExbB